MPLLRLQAPTWSAGGISNADGKSGSIAVASAISEFSFVVLDAATPVFLFEPG